MISVRNTASRWASQVMLLSPYTSGMLAWYRYSAVASTAASTVAGRPSIRASGYRRSAVWFFNQDSPRLQARLVSTMRSPSACSSMSSQTQPQKVHAAFLTTVRLTVPPASLDLLPAQTGRHEKRSAQLPAKETPADAVRHVPAALDHFPWRGGARPRASG